MRSQPNGILKYLLIFLLVVLTLRFLPLLARVVQALAIGVRSFWWLILPLLLGGWVMWKIKRRRDNYEDENHPIRDVTDSATDESN